MLLSTSSSPMTERQTLGCHACDTEKCKQEKKVNILCIIPGCTRDCPRSPSLTIFSTIYFSRHRVAVKERQKNKKKGKWRLPKDKFFFFFFFRRVIKKPQSCHLTKLVSYCFSCTRVDGCLVGFNWNRLHVVGIVAVSFPILVSKSSSDEFLICHYLDGIEMIWTLYWNPLARECVLGTCPAFSKPLCVFGRCMESCSPWIMTCLWC